MQVGRGVTSPALTPLMDDVFRLTAEETLAENSVIYGGVCNRRLAKERPAPQTLQIDFLSKVTIIFYYAENSLFRDVFVRFCPTTTI